MKRYNRHIRGSNPYCMALAALLLVFALVRVEQYVAEDVAHGLMVPGGHDLPQIKPAPPAIAGSAFKGSDARVVAERIPKRDVDDDSAAREVSDGREHLFLNPAGERAPRAASPASLSLFLLHEALLL